MTYTVSITSQGQISIPASLRRKLGFNKTGRAIVTEEKGNLLIKPARDILDFKGSFKTGIKAPPEEMRQSFEEYLGSRVIRKGR